MEVNLELLFQILRDIALRELNLSMPGFIGYRELSQQYAERPGGDWIEPHQGWDESLAEIDRRCVNIFREGFRPVLSVIVVHQDGDRRPGGGFWGIRTLDGQQVTPRQRSEEEWVAMCNAVYAYSWPPSLADLPARAHAIG